MNYFALKIALAFHQIGKFGIYMNFERNFPISPSSKLDETKEKKKQGKVEKNRKKKNAKKPVHRRSSNKQSQESLRGNRPLSTNRFTRRYTYVSTTPSNVRFEKEARKKLYWHWISFWVCIRGAQRGKQEREYSKIRLSLTKKISSRKCYCGEIF